MSVRGWALFAAMCVIWGIPYLLIKVSVESLSPVTLVMLRTGIGAMLLVPLALRRGAVRPLLARWRVVLVYTAVEVTAPWLLLSHAETRLSSSLAGLLVAAVPLIGVALAAATGGDERVGSGRLAGLLLGLLGVAVLLGFDVQAGDLWAVGEMGLVTIGYAVGPMLISRQMRDLPAAGVIAASLAVSALAYLPFGVTHLPGSLPPGRVLAAVATLAVLCTAVAFILFFALIAEVGPVRATVITYVNPAVAVALGVVLLGEPFGAGTAAGFVLILAGSVLSTRRGASPVTGRSLPGAEVEAELEAVAR